MRAFWLGVPLIAALSSACGNDVNCTLLFAYGLNVRVEASDGTQICDATVTATEGSYSETLTAGGDCNYLGAGERAGTYRIRAEKSGFNAAVQEDVVVDEDECHVMGENVELTMTSTS